MDESKSHRLSFIVDKLTKSIENRVSKDSFHTNILQINNSDLQIILKSNWQFNWLKEIQNQNKEVFKLTITNNTKIIQGLISLQDREDHIHVHLLESAEFNKGKSKLYLGVPGNLMAFACKMSFSKGYDGIVSFDSKTNLINHYKKTLNAKLLFGNKMYLDTESAQMLLLQYFKE